MFSIHVDMTPTTRQLKRFIRGVEKEAVRDLRPFWEGWATPVVIEEIGRIFATEGYGTWPPLSDRYAAYKRRFFPGKSILRRQDLYFRAATQKGVEGNLQSITPTDMVWGVDLGYFARRFGFPYPAVHEVGHGNIPKRAVFETAEQSAILERNLVAALKDYLKKVVERETKRHFGQAR